MPYKCTACGRFYREGSDELKKVMHGGGCDCGKKFLMYVRGLRGDDIPDDVSAGWDKQDESEAKKYSEIVADWEGGSESIDEQLDVVKVPLGGENQANLEFLQTELARVREDKKPVFLGIETIRVLEEGKYELDVAALMKGKPLIVKTHDGIYYIDVPYAMRKKGLDGKKKD